MVKTKNILLIYVISILITSCGIKATSTTPTMTVVVETPTQQAYPNSIEQITIPTVDSAYPGPGNGNGVTEPISTFEYYVTQLVIPTPASGKAIVTGQLLIGGEGGQPYLNPLYLASTIPPSTPDYPPMISFSEQTDQLGIQDVNTGQFVFTDVAPGQYAIVMWTPFGGNPLVDKSGASIIFTVNADEVKDLGIIPVK
jgi:hypothetical protein